MRWYCCFDHPTPTISLPFINKIQKEKFCKTMCWSGSMFFGNPTRLERVIIITFLKFETPVSPVKLNLSAFLIHLNSIQCFNISIKNFNWRLSFGCKGGQFHLQQIHWVVTFISSATFNPFRRPYTNDVTLLNWILDPKFTCVTRIF